MQLMVLPVGAGPRRRHGGFTLIELMVTLAVFAILALLAMPSFNTWIANSRIRAMGEDMANGLRLAQTEALRRSRRTAFALTSANPAGNDANAPTYTAAQDGNNWAVNVVPSQIDGNAATFVRGSAIADIASGVNVTGPAAICFDPLGRLITDDTISSGVGANCGTLTAGVSAQIYKITSASAAGDHPLNIEVGLGGQVRLCNPSATPDSPGASEGCQYSSLSP